MKCFRNYTRLVLELINGGMQEAHALALVSDTYAIDRMSLYELYHWYLQKHESG